MGVRPRPHHQPGETAADQRQRHGIVPGLVPQVGEHLAAVAAAELVQHLVHHLAGRHLGADLVGGVGKAGAGGFGLALKFGCVAHCVCSFTRCGVLAELFGAARKRELIRGKVLGAALDDEVADHRDDEADQKRRPGHPEPGRGKGLDERLEKDDQRRDQQPRAGDDLDRAGGDLLPALAHLAAQQLALGLDQASKAAAPGRR